jgi:hypothetical protein
VKTLLISVVLISSAAFSHAQTTSIETVPVKELERTGSLSTCSYAPTEQEAPFYKKLGKNEASTGSFITPYDLRGKRNKFISWYGIVRGVKAVAGNPGSFELLLEQQYFDGMTDCHIMLVSKSGAGDFLAHVTSENGMIPALSLVRVYGKVISETSGIPLVEAQHIRVWPWFTFTLTDLGAEDHTNPLWKKACKPCQTVGRIYNPYPAEEYYLAVLGDPKDYGKMLPADEWPKQ